MAKQQTAKVLYIQIRYFIKRNGSVCCKVVSGENTYTTCVHANGRTSCTCDAGQFGRSCKHVLLVVSTEHARKVATVPTPTESTEIRETDGLEASGLSVKEIWQAREKRAKAMQREYAVQFNAKLNAIKQQQQSEVA
jgi:hypothetical protein